VGHPHSAAHPYLYCYSLPIYHYLLPRAASLRPQDMVAWGTWQACLPCPLSCTHCTALPSPATHAPTTTPGPLHTVPPCLLAISPTFPSPIDTSVAPSPSSTRPNPTCLWKTNLFASSCLPQEGRRKGRGGLLPATCLHLSLYPAASSPASGKQRASRKGWYHRTTGHQYEQTYDSIRLCEQPPSGRTRTDGNYLLWG